MSTVEPYLSLPDLQAKRVSCRLVPPVVLDFVLPRSPWSRSSPFLILAPCFPATHTRWFTAAVWWRVELRSDRLMEDAEAVTSLLCPNGARTFDEAPFDSEGLAFFAGRSAVWLSSAFLFVLHFGTPAG